VAPAPEIVPGEHAMLAEVVPVLLPLSFSSLPHAAPTSASAARTATSPPNRRI
jgi:hypothetical protein